MPYVLKLAKEAKKSGADRYASEEIENLNIYVPQSISRPNGKPLESITINIEVNVHSS